MPRRPGPSAAVLVGMLAAAVGTGAATARAADPLVGAPVVGQCHDMSPDELAAASYDDATVDCATTHTATTIAVAELPEGLDLASGRLELFALETCFAAQRTALGTTARGVRLTAYDLGWFVPTAEQQAAGARWVRCDLVLGDARELRPLPTDVRIGKAGPTRPWRGASPAGPRASPPARSRTPSGPRPRCASTPPATRPARPATRIGTDRCRKAVSTSPTASAGRRRPPGRPGPHAVCYSRTTS